MRFRRLIASLLVCLWASPFPSDRGWSAPVMDQAAPPLVLTTLDGKSFDLAQLRGKVVLVNYWATWCAPCRVEIPVLGAFYRRYRDQGLEIVGISVDFRGDIKKVPRAAAGIAYPVALIGAITDNGFGPPEGVPLTSVVDAQGIVRDKLIAIPKKQLDDVVVPLLPH